MIGKQGEISTVTRYLLSCKQCAFSADATELRTLGSQLNTHGSVCIRDPVLVLDAERDQTDSAVQIRDEPQTSSDRDAQQSILTKLCFPMARRK